MRALHLIVGIWDSQKKRRDLANGNGTVVTYYCSQLEGEQSKHVQKTTKGLGWRFGIMQRYHCNGWLHITVPSAVFSGVQQRVRVRITHDEAHPPPPVKPDIRDGRGRFVPGRSGEPNGTASSTPTPSTAGPQPTNSKPRPAPVPSSSLQSAVPYRKTSTPSQESSSSDYHHTSAQRLASPTPHGDPTPPLSQPLPPTLSQPVRTNCSFNI